MLRRLRIAAIAAIFLSTPASLAGVVNWLPNADGLWSTPANWSSNPLLPGMNDDVLIDVGGATVRTITHSSGMDTIRSLTSNENIALSGGSLSIYQASSISGSLSMSGGELTGTGDLTVTGGINWTIGRMSGTGRTVIAPGGVLTLNTASSILWLSRVVENNGITTWAAGTNNLGFDRVPFTNSATGVFNVSVAAQMYNSSGTNAFNNAGVFNRSGTGTTTIAISFNNTGTVHAQEGTLALTGGGASSGIFDIDAAATMPLPSGRSYSFNTGAVISGTGAFSLNGGTLTGTGDLTVTGGINWTSGTMSGTGQTVIASGGVLTLNTASGAPTLSRVVVNNGTTSWVTGIASLSFNGGTFNNAATGVFNVSVDALMYNMGGTNALNNAGVFNRSGTGTTTTIGIPFNNTGTVHAQEGTLALTGGGTSSGIFNIDAAGALTLPSGNYSYSFNTGAVISGSGAFSLNGGTLTGTGDLTVTGGINWTSGTMSGPGRTVIASGGVLTLSTTSGNPTLSRVVENNSTTSWATGTADLVFNGGTFNNNASGVFNVSAAGTMSGSGMNAFNNAGTFNSSGTGTTTIAIPFNNTGTVHAQGGTLALAGGGTNTGTFNIDTGATINITGGIYNFGTGANTTGAGSLGLTAGTLSVIQPSTVGSAASISGGTLAGSGDVTFGGGLIWSGGSMTGTGRTVIASGGSLNLNTSYIQTPTISRTVENNGTASWNTGTHDLVFSGGTFTNAATGVFNTSVTAWMSGGGTNAFNNAGVFNRSGTGTTTIAIPFNNTGTVHAQGGTLALTRGGTSSGIFNIDAAGALTLPISGFSYSFNTGAVISGSGAFSLNGGELTGTGDLTVTGGINWTSGTMSGTGRTVIAPGGVLTLSTTSGSPTLSRVVENNSTTLWASGTNSLNLNGGTFINTANGVFNVSVNATMYGGGTGAFNNAGTFNRNGLNSTTTIASPFNNTGTVHAQGGTLALTGGGASSGIFDIDAAGALTLPSGVNSYSFNTGAVIAGTGAFSLNGGTLTGTGDLTVTGGINWTSGTMSGTGRTVIASGGVLTMNAFMGSLVLNRVLENNGTTSWTANSTYSLSFSGGTFNNTASGVFNASAASTMYGFPTGAFNNSGVFNRSGSGTTNLYLPFNNTGTVHAQGGTLALTGGGASSGIFDIDVAGALTLSNGYTYGFNTGAVISGTGAFSLNGGTLTGTGDLTVTGGINWTSGTMSGTGRTVIAPEGVLTLNAAINVPTLSRVVENNGTTTWPSSVYSLNFNGGTFNNAATGVFNASANKSMSSSGGTNAFNNAGTFNRSDLYSTTTIAIPFNNTGTVHVQCGTLALAGGGTSSGIFNIDAAGALTLPSGSSYAFNTGAVISGTGAFSLNGGTLTGTGDLTVTGGINWTSGTMSGPGRTVIASGGVLTLDTTSGSPTLSRVVDNNGTTSWPYPRYVFIFKGGTFNNNPTGVFTVSGGSINSVGANVFNNAGIVNSVSTTSINIPFNNSGIVNITGSLVLSGDITNTYSGTFNIAGGNLYLLGSAHALTGSARFTGPGSVYFQAPIQVAGGANVTSSAPVVQWSTTTLSPASSLTISANYSASGTIGGGGIFHATGGVTTMNASQQWLAGAGMVIDNATLIMSTDAGSVSAWNLNLTANAGANVTFNSREHLASLALTGGTAKLQSGGKNMLLTNLLTVASGASLDLADNTADLDYTGASPYDSIRQLVTSNGIFTSLAHPTATTTAVVVPIDNTIAQVLNWKGETISDGADFSQILLAYAYLGDANLDGVVDATDLALTQAGIGRTNASWLDGDINLDGQVNQADYDMLLANFGSGITLGTPLVGLSDAIRVVPELGILSLLPAGVVMLIRRRSKKNLQFFPFFC